MQDLTGKITGSVLTAAEFVELVTEVKNIIEANGQVSSSGDLNQVGKSLANYDGSATFYTDSGAANAYVLTPISGYQGPSAYSDGMRIRFVAANANTSSSCTVNVNGLGSRTMVREDGETYINGDISSSIASEFYFDSGSNSFKHVNVNILAKLIQHAVKNSSQTITNSTTLTNDVGLNGQIQLEATKYYRYDIMLVVDQQTASTGGFKYSFSPSAGSFLSSGKGTVEYMNQSSQGLSLLQTPAAGVSSTYQLGANEIANSSLSEFPAFVRLKGVVGCDSDCSLNFQWAQETADATGTIMEAGSCMTFTKIS